MEKPPKANMRRVQRNGSKYKSESYTFSFLQKTFQIISFSIHIYFFCCLKIPSTRWSCLVELGFSGLIDFAILDFGLEHQKLVLKWNGLWLYTWVMWLFPKISWWLACWTANCLKNLTFSRKNELLGPTLKMKLLYL